MVSCSYAAVRIESARQPEKCIQRRECLSCLAGAVNRALSAVHSTRTELISSSRTPAALEYMRSELTDHKPTHFRSSQPIRSVIVTNERVV